MQELYLYRLPSRPFGTFGTLVVDDYPICSTLEPEVCFRPGSYLCIPHDSPAHPNTWEVTGVIGHEAVLIHNGNTIADTKLCILVGSGFGVLAVAKANMVLPAILDSDLTLAKLRKELDPQFSLTIFDATGEKGPRA